MVTRAIARKVNIKTIIQAPYTAGGSIDNPNHITLGSEKVTRVNTLGTIEDKYENPEANFSSLTIKDNNSQIKVKFFEKKDLNEFQKGNLIKIIGKVREANDERFILGEIIKKQKPEYKKTREQELFKFTPKTENLDNTRPPLKQQIQKTEKNQKPIIKELGSVNE